MREKTAPGITPRREFTVAALLIAAGAAYCSAALRSAIAANGGPGFPLDDPWIHLQFARNLRLYGAFSYYHGDMVTAGSTSPLYTLILAAGFILTSNEMLLSYVLGIAFFAAGGVFFHLLLRRLLPGRPFLALAGLALYLLEPHLAWASMSGMETTCFIAGLMAAFYAFAVRAWRSLALALGVLLWIRPEALIVLGLCGTGAVYVEWTVAPAKEGGLSRLASCWRAVRIPALIFCLCAAAYVTMNLVLSGSVFPNTFAAKIKYYGGASEDFPAQVYAYFTGGQMTAIALLAALGAVAAVYGLIRKRQPGPLMLVGWIVLMFLAYWKNLPFLYQNGRYMMPAIPAFLALGVLGAAAAGDFLARKLFPPSMRARELIPPLALVLVPIVQFIAASGSARQEYARDCKYIDDRQVKTARWLHDNLPADAVIATHDIGAIAYYSGRRVVDMMGLVAPEMIANLRNLDSLVAFLARKHVTHLVVLRNWFEVVNVNPIFQTDEAHPEVMEVFRFDSARIHIMGGSAPAMERAGLSYLSRGDPRTAVMVLSRAVQVDPVSARLRLDLGVALLAAGRTAEADSAFQGALEIQPTLWNARVGRAQVEVALGRPEEAVAHLHELISEHPDVAPAYTLLASVYVTVLHDTAAAREAINQYHARMPGGGR